MVKKHKLRKKVILSTLFCSALLAVTSATAFAAANNTETVSYPVCSVENCNESVNHIHDGVTYCGHTLDDGHEYHLACNNAYCYETGVHDHDNCTYFGHAAASAGSSTTYSYRGHHGARRGGHCGGGRHC